MARGLLKSLLLMSLAGLLAEPCTAAGVNLAWDDCPGMGGVSSRAWACDANTGVHQLVGSFVGSRDHPGFVGVEVLVDIHSEASALPDWWQFFNPGSCRRLALSVSFDFVAQQNDSCADPWQGLGVGGIAAYHTATTYPPVPDGSPGSARLMVAAALAEPNPLAAGTEYYCFRLAINHSKTVGTGNCPGCIQPACVRLTQIKVAENDGGVEWLVSPERTALVEWQTPATPCETAQARAPVWRDARSIYR
ncbi:MAG: hypothetical protein HZC42_12405 [Candidatus Eisenbacteria bacterium]|nr:hypothetical protein [Candidatus Eisenbacteria bacterium]